MWYDINCSVCSDFIRTEFSVIARYHHRCHSCLVVLRQKYRSRDYVVGQLVAYLRGSVYSSYMEKCLLVCWKGKGLYWHPEIDPDTYLLVFQSLLPFSATCIIRGICGLDDSVRYPVVTRDFSLYTSSRPGPGITLYFVSTEVKGWDRHQLCVWFVLPRPVSRVYGVAVMPTGNWTVRRCFIKWLHCDNC